MIYIEYILIKFSTMIIAVIKLFYPFTPIIALTIIVFKDG